MQKNEITSKVYEGFRNIKNVSTVKTDDMFLERDSHLYNFDTYVPFRTDAFIPELISLIYASPTLLGCIEKLTDFTIGQGFKIDKSRTVLGEVNILDISDDELMALSKFIESPQNLNGETLMEIIYKCAFNLWGIGNCFVEITKNKNSIALYSHECKDIKPKRDKSRIIKKYGFCSTSNWFGNEVIDINAYPNFSDATADDDTQKSIIRVSKYALSNYYWGLPKWIAGKLWAELEYLIAKRNISHFRNGMIPSGILQIFGSMTKEEADEYVKIMSDKFTGTDNDFKVLFQIVRDPANKANFVPLATTDQDGAYMDLERLCKEMICTPIGISTSLLSTKSAGEIGSNQQLRTEFETLYNTIIVKVQNDLLNKIVIPYLRECSNIETFDIVLRSALKKVNLNFINIIPVSFMGDINIDNILTMEEKRNILGF